MTAYDFHDGAPHLIVTRVKELGHELQYCLAGNNVLWWIIANL